MSRRRKDLDTQAWRRQRQRVIERDGHACTKCGDTEDLTADHIDPHAMTNKDTVTDDELATLCRTCNGRKSDLVAVRLDYRAPGWFD